MVTIVTRSGKGSPLTNDELDANFTNLNTGKLGTGETAAAAAKLATPRNINGVPFDGSSDITVADGSKEPAITAGTNVQFWRGDKSWQDLAAAVRSVVLTGFSTAASTVVDATDSVLSALGKLQAQLTLTAPLASPALTGTPTAPTAAAGTNTTQIATTAFATTAAADPSAVADATKDRIMAKYLRWKNYGNGHVIIDASNGTSPTGSTISNTNADAGWNPSYPTLMGWNGSNTYGVRVDTARYAESTTYATALSGSGGSAPHYSCRFWVNFYGVGGISYRAYANLSSISRVAAGLYDVNFAAAMPDANYVVTGTCAQYDTGGNRTGAVLTDSASGAGVFSVRTASSCRLVTWDNSSDQSLDAFSINIAVFR